MDLPESPDEILAWAGADRDRCEVALDAELKSADPRNGLVQELSRRMARIGYVGEGAQVAVTGGQS